MGLMTRKASFDEVEALKKEVRELRALVSKMDGLDELASCTRKLEHLQELHCVSDDKLHMLVKHLGLKFTTGTRIDTITP